MRVESFIHGPPIDTYHPDLKDYNGRHLNSKDFARFIKELPGGSVSVQHSTDGCIGSIEKVFVENPTGALKAIFNVYTNTKSGQEAARRIRNGELWAVSLFYKTPMAFSVDNSWAGYLQDAKQFIELSLTDNPERRECIITHFEDDSKIENNLSLTNKQRVSDSYKHSNNHKTRQKPKDQSHEMNTSAPTVTPPTPTPTSTTIVVPSSQGTLQSAVPSTSTAPTATPSSLPPPSQGMQDQTKNPLQIGKKQGMVENPHTSNHLGGMPPERPSGITEDVWAYMLNAYKNKLQTDMEMQKKQTDEREKELKERNERLVQSVKELTVDWKNIGVEQMKKDANPYSKDVEEKMIPNLGKWAQNDPDTAFFVLQAASASTKAHGLVNAEKQKQIDDLMRQLDETKKEREMEATKRTFQETFFNQMSTVLLPTNGMTLSGTSKTPWATPQSFPNSANWMPPQLQLQNQSQSQGQGQSQSQPHSHSQPQHQHQPQHQFQSNGQSSAPWASSNGGMTQSNTNLIASGFWDIPIPLRHHGALEDPTERKELYSGFSSDKTFEDMFNNSGRKYAIEEFQ